MIYISVGHHRAKQGASYQGVTEYQLASVWGAKVVSILHYMELPAQLVFGTLKEKVIAINGNTPMLAVEIHFNSAVNAQGDRIGAGSETLYYPNSMKGKRLAQCIQQKLGGIFKPNRGIKEGWYRMDKQYGPDYFLAKTKCPSVIVEPEFIHRTKDIQEKRLEGCAAIAEGIDHFYRGEIKQ